MRALLTIIFAAILFGCGASAQTEVKDIEAIYSGADGAFEMTIQYSKEGDLKGTTKDQDMWLLRLDEVNYFIFPAQSGPNVLDLRIASKLMREVMPDDLPDLDDLGLALREDGPTEVNGRKGIGYRFAGQPESGPYFAVISSDPALQRLGDAMSAQLKSSIEMNPLAENSADSMLEVMGKGAPLSFGGSDLVSFEETELDRSIFELPNEPMNKEASRALMIDRKMIPAEKIQLRDFSAN